ncbi:MAG: GNAT family N-acetyltransferase [Rhodocyclales bacterium]|nr:GNAT family N-acetyltransferase [Rhodocyclales bacterium]
MSQIILRPVTEAELPLLATILAEMDGNDPFPVESIRAKWQEMQRFPDYVCYFAEAGGEIVGTLSLNVFPVLSGTMRSEAIAEAVVIRPQYRGRGLGRAMLRTAMKMAADKGAYKLALSSNLRRLDAHRFYDGMGFTRHGFSFSIDTAELRG